MTRGREFRRSLRKTPIKIDPFPLAYQAISVRSVAMPTVKLVDENDANPIVRRVFADIKATKKIDRIPNIWRALASHPEHLELCWTRLKVIMAPGKVDALTKEIVALAVSATNGCSYCINSHSAAVQKLGLNAESYAEILAVIGLYNQMNKLADALQIEPDIRPEPF
jgi:AhpD family alkylhydroperoxidase